VHRGIKTSVLDFIPIVHAQDRAAFSLFWFIRQMPG
jgi:hypothetical protein